MFSWLNQLNPHGSNSLPSLAKCSRAFCFALLELVFASSMESFMRWPTCMGTKGRTTGADGNPKNGWKLTMFMVCFGKPLDFWMFLGSWGVWPPSFWRHSREPHHEAAPLEVAVANLSSRLAGWGQTVQKVGLFQTHLIEKPKKWSFSKKKSKPNSKQFWAPDILEQPSHPPGLVTACRITISHQIHAGPSTATWQSYGEFKRWKYVKICENP